MFKKSFAVLWANFGFVLACIGIDAFFFFALGFFTSPISFKIKEILIGLTAVFATALKNMGRPDQIMNALLDSKALVFWKSLAGYAVVFVLIIYVIYVLLQSITWNLTLRMIGKHIRFPKYIKSFALLNLFWFLLFVIYNIIDLFGDIRHTLKPVKGINFIAIFANVFLLLVVYFAIISYTKLNLKKSFITGWRNYKKILSPFLVMFLYFVALNFVLSYLFALNFTLGTVVGIALFFPALTWARVYMALTINKVK